MHKLNAQLRPGEKLIVVSYSGGCGEGTAARARAPHLASEAHLFDPIGVEPEVDMITTKPANLVSKFNVHIDQVQEVCVLPALFQNTHKTFIIHFQKEGQSS